MGHVFHNIDLGRMLSTDRSNKIDAEAIKWLFPIILQFQSSRTTLVIISKKLLSMVVKPDNKQIPLHTFLYFICKSSDRFSFQQQ